MYVMLFLLNCYIEFLFILIKVYIENFKKIYIDKNKFIKYNGCCLVICLIYSVI